MSEWVRGSRLYSQCQPTFRELADDRPGSGGRVLPTTQRAGCPDTAGVHRPVNTSTSTTTSRRHTCSSCSPPEPCEPYTRTFYPRPILSRKGAAEYHLLTDSGRQNLYIWGDHGVRTGACLLPVRCLRNCVRWYAIFADLFPR